MNEAAIQISNFYIYGFGLLAVFSFLWGGFVYYKKAVETHLEESTILDVVVVAAFWAFIVGRLAFVLLNWGTFWNHFPRILLLADFPGLDAWGAISGIALGVYFGARKAKARFLDWFDLVCLGILSGEAVFLAGIFMINRVWSYLILAGIYLLGFLIFWQVEQNYRMFNWYRGKRTSSRSGLLTGFTLSFWGITNSLGAIILKQNSNWVLIWFGLMFVGGLVLVYIRSGRTVAEDIKNISKYVRRK